MRQEHLPLQLPELNKPLPPISGKGLSRSHVAFGDDGEEFHVTRGTALRISAATISGQSQVGLAGTNYDACSVCHYDPVPPKKRSPVSRLPAVHSGQLEVPNNSRNPSGNTTLVASVRAEKQGLQVADRSDVVRQERRSHRPGHRLVEVGGSDDRARRQGLDLLAAQVVHLACGDLQPRRPGSKRPQPATARNGRETAHTKAAVRTHA